MDSGGASDCNGGTRDGSDLPDPHGEYDAVYSEARVRALLCGEIGQGSVERDEGCDSDIFYSCNVSLARRMSTLMPSLGIPFLMTRNLSWNPRHGIEEMTTIIYTSGFTNQPNGVMHNFKSIKMTIACFCSNIHSTNKNRYLSYSPLAHSMECWLGECHTLCAGNHLYVAESLNSFV